MVDYPYGNGNGHKHRYRHGTVDLLKEKDIVYVR